MKIKKIVKAFFQKIKIIPRGGGGGSKLVGTSEQPTIEDVIFDKYC